MRFSAIHDIHPKRRGGAANAGGDNITVRRDVPTRYIGIGAWQTGQNNRTLRVMGREPAAG